MALTRIKTDQILDGTITGSDIASGTDIASNNLTLTGDLRGPSIFTIDPAAIGDNTGTVVIAGDLQVDGATTTINSSTLTVDDKQIVIASGATDNTSADGAGILIDGANATITYDGTNDRFEINKDVQIIGGSISGTDVDVSGATFTVANDQISGDAINGGTATPTTLNSTNLNVDSGTLFVDSANGRVGVGTSSPTRLLDVNGEAIFSGLIRTRAGSVTAASVGLDDNDTGLFKAGTNQIGFTTGGSEAARIDSSGNLLVGRTSDSSTTPGFGAFNNGFHRMVRDGAPPLGIGRLSSDGDIIVFQKDGSIVGSIGVAERSTESILNITNPMTHVIFNADDPGAVSILGSDWTASPRIQSDIDGNVDLGRGVNRFKDLYLSGGVYLGGTGSANYLDDYEEGTWTPVIADAASGGTSANGELSNYVKIGSLVVLNFGLQDIDLSSFNNNNHVILRNLPFPSNPASGVRPQGSLHVRGVTFEKYLTPQIANDATFMNILNNADNAGFDPLVIGDLFSSGFLLYVTISYYTDS